MVGLFDLYHIHIRRCPASKRESDHFAIQTQQPAFERKRGEVVQRLHNRAGFPLKVPIPRLRSKAGCCVWMAK